MMTGKLTGSCLCRGVRFEVEGDLGTVAICHCEDCRKAQGSAFAVNAPVARKQLRIAEGEALLASFESSPGKHRIFCSRCGSPVMSRRDDEPDTVRLRLGTFDGDPGARPVLHGWTGDKAPWDRLPDDDLPRFAGGTRESLVPRVRIRVEAPGSPEAQALIAALDEELARIYPADGIFGLHDDDHEEGRMIFFLARTKEKAVGCGALRSLDQEIGEVKRMYVLPGYRGGGLARRLLGMIEAAAVVRRHSVLRLETGVSSPAALSLYRSSGYREIPLYGEYVTSPHSVCFEKRL